MTLKEALQKHPQVARRCWRGIHVDPTTLTFDDGVKIRSQPWTPTPAELLADDWEYHDSFDRY